MTTAASHLAVGHCTLLIDTDPKTNGTFLVRGQGSRWIQLLENIPIGSVLSCFRIRGLCRKRGRYKHTRRDYQPPENHFNLR